MYKFCVQILSKRCTDFHTNEEKKNNFQIEPCIITQFISRRVFLLEIPFEIIQQILQILLKYIAPMDILHDLWAFRYAPDVIELRMNQAKLGGKKKLMPWMIRCPKNTLLK